MGTHIPVIPEVLVERLVQEPRKKGTKAYAWKSGEGHKEELAKAFQLLLNVRFHESTTWICVAEGWKNHGFYHFSGPDWCNGEGKFFVCLLCLWIRGCMQVMQVPDMRFTKRGTSDFQIEIFEESMKSE